MNRIYLLDEVIKIHRTIIEKKGCFTSEECEKIAASLEMDNVSLVAMLEAIRKDLSPKKFVLNLKNAERFQLLRIAFQKNAEHALIKKIAPELTILEVNFKKPQADEEACQTAINNLRSQIEPYTDKVPKLVKYLNEYASLCEANFLNVLKLKVLRINLRLLPLLKEAKGCLAECDDISDENTYWRIAGQLYSNHSALFKKEDIYYFGVIRGIMDAFYREMGREPILLDVPTEIALLEEVQPKTVMIIEEKPEDVAEEKTEDTAEVTEMTEAKEIVTEVDLSEEESGKETEAEQIESNSIGSEAEAGPELEAKPMEIKSEQPEVVSQHFVTDEKKNTLGKNAPEIQKKSNKLLYIIGSCVLLVLVSVGVYFATGMKSRKSLSAVGNDTVTIVNDTAAIGPIVAPETSRDTKIIGSKKPESHVQPQAASQTEQKLQSQSQSPTLSQSETNASADKSGQQTEAVKVEKKVQANSLEAAREATQNGDYKKAFDIYKPLADAGNVEAQYCLGLMYETGTGVGMDIFEAVVWYRKAKAKGFKLAERKLQELGYN